MELTPEGRRLVEDVAQRHGVSADAVLTLLQAVAAGHGTSAQFSHPELGGMGQWSQGGMIMVGDMFNNALKYQGRPAVQRAVRAGAQPGAGMGGARIVAVPVAKLRWPWLPEPRARRRPRARRQPVRPGCGQSRQLVAAGARRAVLDRCPEQHPLRLLSGHPPPGHPARRPRSRSTTRSTTRSPASRSSRAATPR